MKNYLFLSIAMASMFMGNLTSEQEIISIDSQEAEFDGQAIQLLGDVHLQYDLGEVHCESAVLLSGPQKEEGTKNIKIRLDGAVDIKISEGGTLSCAFAEIDCAAEEACFYSDARQAFVNYREMLQKSEDKSVALTIQCREMLLKLLKCGESEVSRDNVRAQIDRIEAKGDVKIGYDDILCAEGGGVIYSKAQSSSYSSNGTDGLIVLTPAEHALFCRVTLRGTDYVNASKVTINTADREVTFLSPRGKILNGIAPDEGDEIDFRADKMVWNANTEALTLQGDIEIHQHSLGTLNTDNEVVFTYEEVDGQRKLRNININGRVVVNRFDPKKSLCYMLLNDGTTLIDHKQMSIEMRSLAEEGKSQAHFRGLIGEVYSDRISIGYAFAEKAIIPMKINLDGNVKLLNNINMDLIDGEEVVLQYALADKMEYLPMARQLNMSAEARHRVLFFDKINNIKISAPGLQVTKNEQTGKEVIRGVGDVRFRFLEQELHHLRKRFFFQDGMTDE